MTFDELQLRKERLKNQILRKEYEIRDTGRNLRAGFSLPSIRNQALEYILERPDMMVQTGVMVFNLVRKLRSRNN